MTADQPLPTHPHTHVQRADSPPLNVNPTHCLPSQPSPDQLQIPYFQTDLLTLYLADCLPAMREMPDKAFDLAIVDPPYGIGNWIQVTGNINQHKGKNGSVKWNEIENRPSMHYFAELRRVSRNWIVWGANYFNCFDPNGGAIVWDKISPRENHFSVCEISSTSFNKRVDCVRIQWIGGFTKKTDDLIHPCSKPVALYRWLLTNYAKPGDTILDTHLGSGSIAIACIDMGFSLTAWEIDEDYLKGAVARIEHHLRQPKLFKPDHKAMKQERLL